MIGSRSNSLPSPKSNPPLNSSLNSRSRNNNNIQTTTTTTIPTPLILTNSNNDLTTSPTSEDNLILPSTTNSIDRELRDRLLKVEERGSVVTLGNNEPSFEMLVIGCGGGPLETNLSSYLIKPYSTNWVDGCTALEGGSGLGALSALVESSPYSFKGFNLNIGVDDHEQSPPSTSNLNSTSSSTSTSTSTSILGKKLKEKKKKRIGVGREGGGKCAAKVWQSVSCFAVSHAHLDHIQGLIISSGASICPRPLYGTPHTLTNMANVFDGGVWPSLAGWEDDGVVAGRAYLYREITAPTIESLPLSNSLSFHAFPLSHGLDPAHEKSSEIIECYDSTAFFIKEHITGKGKEVLFFGDVEPDSISKRPLNLAVWKSAAPKIVSGILTTIFLECSYPTSQPTARLWGHLSPPFVIEELKVLANLVISNRIEKGLNEIEAKILPLAGVTIVIIHIKDDILTLAPPISPFELSSSSTSSPYSPRARSFLFNTPNPTNSNLTPIPHSPLTLSPPLPSIATRRASTAFGLSSSHNHHNNNSSSGIGFGLLKKFNKSIGVSGNSLDSGSKGGWDEGRRASSPGFMGMSGGYQQQQQLQSQVNTSSSTGSAENKSIESISFGFNKFGLNSTMEETSDEEQGQGNNNNNKEEEEDSSEEEEMEDESVHERIERELNELEEIERFGVRFFRVEQGSRIAF